MKCRIGKTNSLFCKEIFTARRNFNAEKRVTFLTQYIFKQVLSHFEQVLLFKTFKKDLFLKGFMKKLLLAGLLILLLALAGCGAQKIYFCSDGSVGGNQQITSKNAIYVCPDGIEVNTPLKCHFTLAPTLTSDDAKRNALSFVEGYVRANGWQTTLVNVYKNEDDYKAQIIISKHDETSYETIIKINGTTGVASCEEKCDYVV